MARRSPAPKRRVRSAIDKVLIHDMKNIWFRLNLLLGNLDEHYGDPEFKLSVVDHLHATLDKIEAIVGRSAAHQDGVLIKVSLDLNDLVQQVLHSAQLAPLRGGNGGALRVTTAFDNPPRVWGDPYYTEGDARRYAHWHYLGSSFGLGESGNRYRQASNLVDVYLVAGRVVGWVDYTPSGGDGEEPSRR